MVDRHGLWLCDYLSEDAQVKNSDPSLSNVLNSAIIPKLSADSMKTQSGFQPGMQVKINGTPLHNGKIGTVVDAEAVLGYARATAGKTGQILTEGPIKRAGLIPVFMPDHPETLWWWFAPAQLEEHQGS